MKKIATKIVTISSQIGMVSIFLVLLFSSTKVKEEVIVLENNNFNKMADSVSSLFKKEEMMFVNSSSDNVIVDLDDITNGPVTKEEDTEKETTEEEKQEIKEESKENKEENNTIEPSVQNRVPLDYEVIETYTGNLTGYGPDCYGCSGRTRSGYDLTESVYYDDPEFGTIRILAADYSFGKNAIFRVSNVPGMDPFIAIVLDTGGNVGFNRGTLFDLAFATENDPSIIGLTTNVKFELLRRGTAW